MNGSGVFRGFLVVLSYAAMVGIVYYWGGWTALAVIWGACAVLVSGLALYGGYQRHRDGEL